MASNKHFEVDLLSLNAVEVEAPGIDELLRIADLPSTATPFGNLLKREKFVVDHGKSWLFDKQLSDFNFQRSGYSSEVYQFRVQIVFDTPLELDEINHPRFLYSVCRNLGRSNWRARRQGGGVFFQLGQLDEGSIRADIYAGIVAVGAFVANYPELKQGFQEMLTDAQFVTEQVSTALRAAKIPDPAEDTQVDRDPELWIREEPRRRNPPKRLLVGRDD